jgi:hypothetical protein
VGVGVGAAVALDEVVAATAAAAAARVDTGTPWLLKVPGDAAAGGATAVVAADLEDRRSQEDQEDR